MSRIVRSVGRAISKVARGVTKFVRTVARSGVVRFIGIAAAAYFTAGAALGAIGAASAGTSVVSGAASGLGSAWGGVTGALSGGGLSSLGAGLSQASAAGASGMGFSAASSAVASGQTIAGAGVAAPGAAPAGVGGAVPGAAPVQIAGNAPSYLLNPATNQPLVQAPVREVGRGIVGRAMDFLGTSGGGMVASTGLRLAGGAMVDRAQERQHENELARMNRNQNVSGLTVNYGQPQNARPLLQPGMVQVPEFDPDRFAHGLVGGRFAPVG